MVKAQPIKKGQTLQQPIGEGSYITWGDFNDLSFKLNGVFVTISVWLVLQIWDSYKKSKDTTAQDIKELKEMVSKLVSEIEHRPTYRDILEMREKDQ